MGQRRVVVGVAVAGVAVLMSSLGACSLANQRFTDDAGVDQTIRTVRIATDAGAVTLRTGTSTTVRRTVSYRDDKPGVTHRVEGDALVLGSCPVRHCEVDYEVVVPAGVSISGEVDAGAVDLEGASAVNLRSGAGEVKVRKVSGSVNVVADAGRVDLVGIGGAVAVESQAGAVSVRDVAGDATVRADSGKVEALGIAGKVDARSNAGGVEVRTTKAGEVRAESDSGAITITVPRGSGYRVEAGSDAGHVDNQIGNDTSAAYLVHATTNAGDVVVRFG
ncbi:DUF4097 family beta strand repeat-containing protein [Actinokineospora auranticolor]|uniref:Putative adhesin n=1 Tax=Actinokineospora auranticolor TaxID=155976 RepID=A0A2S6GRY1_9PSEU|nr:DUF4097 family beta strand repeat-containing protein [Actinokineospora auranticolor]PPK67946.1 putative adhesin [Actinokineospora auranticolor]